MISAIFPDEQAFPEFEGEKFLSESAVWDRIGMDGFSFDGTRMPYVFVNTENTDLQERKVKKQIIKAAFGDQTAAAIWTTVKTACID